MYQDDPMVFLPYSVNVVIFTCLTNLCIPGTNYLITVSSVPGTSQALSSLCGPIKAASLSLSFPLRAQEPRGQ